jgi:hypothetical protein
VNVKDTETNLIKIDAVHYDYGLGEKTDEKLQESIWLNRLTPKPLYVHIFPFKEKNLVQFLIFGRYNEVASGVVMGPYLGFNRVTNPNIFKECYYETDYKSFIQLFNIDPAAYAGDKTGEKAKEQEKEKE